MCLSGHLKSCSCPILGDIWQKFKPEGFVDIAEHPPVIPVVERFPNPAQRPEWRINVPDLARIWFIHEDDSQIIQVQRDRFTFNWRKTESHQRYPPDFQPFSIGLKLSMIAFVQLLQI